MTPTPGGCGDGCDGLQVLPADGTRHHASGRTTMRRISARFLAHPVLDRQARYSLEVANVCCYYRHAMSSRNRRDAHVGIPDRSSLTLQVSAQIAILFRRMDIERHHGEVGEQRRFNSTQESVPTGSQPASAVIQLPNGNAGRSLLFDRRESEPAKKDR